MNYYYNNKVKIILNKLRIEKIIGKFVKIKKYGSNYKGFSPFTKENNPSFMISPEKKIWKDFSSGKGGNLINFFVEYMKINYYESINFIFNKFINNNFNFIIKYNYKDNIIKLNEYAKNFYIKNLNKHKNIKKFLFKKKGFNDYIIKKFSIGYSKNYNDLIKYFINKKINKNLIIDSCLFIIKKKIIIDRFINRIIFPIKDIYGNTIGFGGRIINDFTNKYSKYINSPNNILYNKSKVLYGLFEAKKYIIKYDFCYITEGYTDVISLYQNNIKNVISTTGTNITEYHIKIIKKYTNNVILLYDGDKAGIKASIKNIDIFLKNNINIKFFLFYNNYDPNTFILKNKKKKNLNKYFKKKSLNFIQFKIKIFNIYNYNIKNNLFNKYKLIKSIINNISNISNNIIKEIYLQKISNIFNLKKIYLYKEIENIKNKNKYIIYNNKNNFLIKKKKKYIYNNNIIKYIENYFIKKILILKKFINFKLIIKYKKKINLININNIIKKIFKEIKKYNFIFKKKNLIILKNIKKKLKNNIYKKKIINKKKIKNKYILNFFKIIILKYKYYFILDKIKKYENIIKFNKKDKKKNLLKIFFLIKIKNKIEQKLYFL
ncbi:MAG: DNA primase [Candidatus Shikimatogenerans bostrichidophilus]|nr:MAG: DNA primase [Candidatus Shikimatogenerans bostrichidophilus]